MGLTLDSNESSKTLLAGTIGFLAFNPLYFIVYLPLSEIHQTIVFFSSYAAFAAASAVVRLEAASEQKGYVRMMRTYVVLFFGSIVISYFTHYPFFLAVPPAFFTGAGLAVGAALVYRIKRSIRLHENDNSNDEDVRKMSDRDGGFTA
jgi:hypothetical protein